MSKHSLYSRVLLRLKWLLEVITKRVDAFVLLKMSRSEAKNLRKKIIADRGKKIVDRKLKKRIKEYCKSKFGDSSYWYWFALYTEVRGEFICGWMPYDYYRFRFLPRVNPERFAQFSEEKNIDYKLFGSAIVNPVFL